MSEQPPGIPAVQEAYGGLTFDGPALEPLPEAKAFALEQAVELCRQDRDSTAKEVVEVAETFEAYLTGAPPPVNPHSFVDDPRVILSDRDDLCLLLVGPNRICGRHLDDPVHPTRQRRPDPDQPAVADPDQPIPHGPTDH